MDCHPFTWPLRTHVVSLLTPADPAGDAFRSVGQIIVQLSAVEHALRPFLSKVFPQDAQLQPAKHRHSKGGSRRLFL